MGTTNAINEARKYISYLIGSSTDEIIFTSGTTESNNLAIKGLAQFYKKNYILTTSIEHKWIINTWGDLENKGYKLIYLLVNKKVETQQY